MEERRVHTYRGSLFFPILLIGLGLIFLLTNLGLVTGDVWGTVINLWPLLLIAMGLDGIFRRHGLVVATLLIVLGILFLLANFNLLALDVWQVVLRVWPILLVASGFDILIGRRSIWASLAGLVVVLAIMAWLLLGTGTGLLGTSSQQLAPVSQALQGANQAEVVLNPGAGNLQVRALAAGSDSLVSGQAAQGSVPSYSTLGDKATYRLTSSNRMYSIFSPPKGWQWDIGVNPDVPVALRADIGAGNVNLDLTGLDLSDLKVSMGAGQIVVTLPEAGNFNAKVDGAVGITRIVVPKGTAVRIHSETALSNLSVPRDFQKEADRVWTSPGYSGSQDKVELTLSQAIGSITVAYK